MLTRKGFLVCFVFFLFFFFFSPFPTVVLLLSVNLERLFLLQQRSNTLFCVGAPELLLTACNRSERRGSGWKDVSWRMLKPCVPSASAKQTQA